LGDNYIPHKLQPKEERIFGLNHHQKYGEPLILNVDFIDQFGNSHLIKKTKFRPPQLEIKKNEPRMEQIANIKDPLEKEIVGVLQDEVNRYKCVGEKPVA